MSRFILFFGLFLYIYLEISLLLSIGTALGVLPLIGIMLVSSALGVWLLKRSGLIAIWQIKKHLSDGKHPTQAIISSIFLTIAAILLIIPGFLSDIAALFLIFPLTQRIAAQRLRLLLIGKINLSPFKQTAQDSPTFDAEFERKADDDKRIK